MINYSKEDHCSCIHNLCSCEKKAWNCDDLPSNNSSLRSSRICFSYIHNFIIILSQVYNKPIQRPTPSWLVSKALHWYHRVQGFESRTLAWIFFRLSFRNCISCVYNCDDLPSYNSSLCSSHNYMFFIIFIISLQKKMMKLNLFMSSRMIYQVGKWIFSGTA